MAGYQALTAGSCRRPLRERYSTTSILSINLSAAMQNRTLLRQGELDNSIVRWALNFNRSGPNFDLCWETVFSFDDVYRGALSSLLLDEGVAWSSSDANDGAKADGISLSALWIAVGEVDVYVKPSVPEVLWKQRVAGGKHGGCSDPCYLKYESLFEMLNSITEYIHRWGLKCQIPNGHMLLRQDGSLLK